MDDDHQFWDASALLASRVIEEDIMESSDIKKKHKMCSKILFLDQNQYKAYCEGYLCDNNKLNLKIWAVCDDNSI